MTKPLHILILEDRAADADMAVRELRQQGLEFTTRIVMTEAEFAAALREPTLDVILADHSLPAYDGLSALALARNERSEVPFIFVTGTMGEEEGFFSPFARAFSGQR